MTAAARQRLYVERQKNGLVVVPVVAVELDVIDVLKAEGFLDEDNPSRPELATALSKWLFTVTRQRQWPDDVV
jgi:hypothetical protein